MTHFQPDIRHDFHQCVHSLGYFEVHQYQSESITICSKQESYSHPSPMEKLSVAEVCFYRGVFFRPKKTKSPMKELSMGFPWQDLEKVSDATVHRSGDMGRLEKNWPDRRSAGGGGRLAKSLGSKKKVACRVWLVRCSLYVREGASRVKIGVESM